MADQDKAKRDERSNPGPSTNRDPVPDGLEGSIMEPGKGQGQTQKGPDRAEGNERRSDEN
ncbi:MAG: hypothetical protein V4617_00685 [Gemmatimonadota bacterium]